MRVQGGMCMYVRRVAKRNQGGPRKEVNKQKIVFTIVWTKHFGMWLAKMNMKTG